MTAVVVVVVVVVVDVVVVGRGRVVVVVVGLGRVVVVDGATAGGVPGGGGSVPAAGRDVVGVVDRRAARSAASWNQNAMVGSVVVEVGATVVVAVVEVVDEATVERGVFRATWMPRTSVAPTASPSRHFETPTTPSTISSTISRPLRIRSSGL